MVEDPETLFDLLRYKLPRRARRRTADRFRLRDRYHGKGQGQYRYVGHYAWVRRLERDWTFYRAKTHPDTGYGVAYVRNPKLCEM